MQKSVEYTTAAAIFLYVMSFLIPAFVEPFSSYDQVYPGVEAFAIGTTEAPLAWVANPLIWVAVVVLVREHRGIGRAELAAVLAGLATFLSVIGTAIYLTTDTRGQRFVIQPGVVLWIASMALILLGAVLATRRRPAS